MGTRAGYPLLVPAPESCGFASAFGVLPCRTLRQAIHQLQAPAATAPIPGANTHI